MIITRSIHTTNTHDQYALQNVSLESNGGAAGAPGGGGGSEWGGAYTPTLADLHGRYYHLFFFFLMRSYTV
jgi:hypothetical protein